MTGQAPLFILSFRQRDELATLAASAGWQVVAARRVAGAERRFLSSGAMVAVVDARGAPREGLEAAAALSGVIEANGCAMLRDTPNEWQAKGARRGRPSLWDGVSIWKHARSC